MNNASNKQKYTKKGTVTNDNPSTSLDLNKNNDKIVAIPQKNQENSEMDRKKNK